MHPLSADPAMKKGPHLSKRALDIFGNFKIQNTLKPASLLNGRFVHVVRFMTAMFDNFMLFMTDLSMLRYFIRPENATNVW